MRDFLILRLQGMMQGWGTHSFEGLRPAQNFPTRGGVIGLLGACLGIRRDNFAALAELNTGLGLSVCRRLRLLKDKEIQPQVMTDYHTVKHARKEYVGLHAHETIQTWRQYLLDGDFSVALWCRKDASYSLQTLVQAVQKPHYTPFLGRRSCPLGQPLYDRIACAENSVDVFALNGQTGEVVFSEECISGRQNRLLVIRDMPFNGLPRQFANRHVYMYAQEVENVSE